MLIIDSATIVSILRVTFNVHIDVTDPTWGFVKTAILSTIEVSVGVCCACMPIIYTLFRIFMGRKIRPRNHSPTILEPGNHEGPLRPRHHKFAQLDKGSHAKPFWKHKPERSSADSDAPCGGSDDDIAMGDIIVTSKLDVEHTGAPPAVEGALSPTTLHGRPFSHYELNLGLKLVERRDASFPAGREWVVSRDNFREKGSAEATDMFQHASSGKCEWS